MKKLIILLLTVLLSTGAMAASKKWDYETHPKHAKMFCILSGIPVKYCHRKS